MSSEFASGASSARISPESSPRSSRSRSRRVQRVHNLPPCSVPSSGQRLHRNEVVNPAQSEQIAAWSLPRRPGSTRSAPQPGQHPRMRSARSWQVRQTWPSGQQPALNLRRPQRQHSVRCRRSYCSSVA
ncbi:MAG: hypothetical protein ACRDQ9_19370 [Pseudonocardiaceae bacterium]